MQCSTRHLPKIHYFHLSSRATYLSPIPNFLYPSDLPHLLISSTTNANTFPSSTPIPFKPHPPDQQPLHSRQRQIRPIPYPQIGQLCHLFHPNNSQQQMFRLRLWHPTERLIPGWGVVYPRRSAWLHLWIPCFGGE